MRLLRLLSLLPLAFLLSSGPAAAEWLYFKDGTVQEIKGTWKPRGRMLQFTTRAGELQMVAAEEIDLPVSEALSKRARPNAGLYEIRGGPDSRRSGYVTSESLDVVPLDAEWDLVVYSWQTSYEAGGNSPRSKCVVASGLAATDAGAVVVQIGTTIETVDLYGIRAIDPAPLRRLVEGQPLCLVQKEYESGRDDSGRFRAHALTKEGLDLGLELIRQSHAEPSTEPHARSAEYRLAFDSRAGH